MSEVTRERLLSLASPIVEAVESEAFGGTVYVRRMGVAGRDGFIAETDGGKNMGNFKAELLVRCLCDKDGKLLLTKADADTIGQHPAEAIDPIVAAAWRLNGLGEDESGK